MNRDRDHFAGHVHLDCLIVRVVHSGHIHVAER